MIDERTSWRSFLLLWAGQVISVFGSGLTGFALGVLVFQRTGSVSAYTLIAVCASVPGLLLSPIAGALVDRWDSRRLLLLSDLGAALGTVALVLLVATGSLEIWHVYLIVAWGAACSSVQIPTFQVAVAALIPRRHLGRANGMLQFGESSARILAPLASGLLLGALALYGIILIDIATFVIAVAMLLLVRLPPRQLASSNSSLLRQAAFGFRYIALRRGLALLTAYFAALNLLVASALVLVTPLVLSFATPKEVGLVLSCGSFGMLAGSMAMSLWGGPRQRVRGILMLSPLLGLGLLLASLRPSLPLVAAGMLWFFALVPIVNSCNQAVWQSRVEPEVQGRVFAARRLMAQGTTPLAYLVAGTLADRLAPLLQPGGTLSGTLGRMVGLGDGRGIALILFGMGITIVLAGLGGLLVPQLLAIDCEEGSDGALAACNPYLPPRVAAADRKMSVETPGR